MCSTRIIGMYNFFYTILLWIGQLVNKLIEFEVETGGLFDNSTVVSIYKRKIAAFEHQLGSICITC